MLVNSSRGTPRKLNLPDCRGSDNCFVENRLSTSNSTVKKATTDILFVVAFFVCICAFSVVQVERLLKQCVAVRNPFESDRRFLIFERQHYYVKEKQKNSSNRSKANLFLKSLTSMTVFKKACWKVRLSQKS